MNQNQEVSPSDFDALWDFNDPAGSESAFRKVLEETGPNAPTPWRAELLTQIARTLGLQGRFDEADALLDEVLPLAEGNFRAMARWYLERGRVRNSSGRKEEAIPLFEGAFANADAAGADYLAVDALHMLAIAAPPETQMGWHQRAIDRAKASADPKTRNWRASLLNNLAWTLHDAGKLVEALAAFQEALEARVEQGIEGPIRIARWSIARCLRSLGKPADALEEQRKLHQENQSGGTSDGFVQEEIGECLLELGRREESMPHFAQAHEILSQDPWLAESEPARLARMKELSG